MYMEGAQVADVRTDDGSRDFLGQVGSRVVVKSWTGECETP